MHIYLNNKNLRYWPLIFSVALIFGCQVKKNELGRVSIINPDYAGGTYDAYNNQYILWGSDGVISRSRDGENWLQHSMGTAKTIQDIALREKYLLAVGSSNSVLESYNAGGQWEIVEHFSSESDYLTALLRQNGDKLIAGTNGQLLLQLSVESTKNEAKWQALTLSSGTIRKLIEHGDTLIAAGDNGFLATSKNAVQWQKIQTNLSSSISHLVSSGEMIVALAAKGNFLMSDDGGQTWQAFHTKVSAPFSAAAFSDDQTHLVVAAQNGQIIYANLLENTWLESEVRLNGEALGVSNLTFIAESKRFLAAGHSGLFAFSSDAGATWKAERLNDSFGAQKIVFNPLLKQLISFGQGGELHISGSMKYAWKPIQQNLVGYYRIAQAFNNHWLTLGSVGEVVTAKHLKNISSPVRSVNQWELHNVQYPNETTPPYYRSLLRLTNGDLLAAGPTGAILKSTDKGLNWRPVLWTPFVNNDAFTQLVFNPYERSVIAIEAEGRFYLSRDGGESWLPRTLDVPNRIWQADVNPANGVVVAAGQEGQAAVYSPNTNSWKTFQIPNVGDLYGCFYSSSHQQFFLSGQKGVLLQGDDNGDNWEIVKTKSMSTLRNIGEASNGDLIGFGQEQTILHKARAAKEWRIVHSQEKGELRRLRVHPLSKEVFIVGSHGTLLNSSDNGLNWNKVLLQTEAGFRDMAISANKLLLVGEKLAIYEL